MKTRSIVTLLFLAAPLLLLLRSSASPAQEEAAAAATVQATDEMVFDPPLVHVKVGDVVLWKNSSSVEHTVTDDPGVAQRPQDAQLPQGAKPFDSGNLQPGQVFTHKFTVPGTYKYFCKPHEMNGMVGTVVVK